MRKIKLFPAPHLEIRISVSDEMVEDLRKCWEACKSFDWFDDSEDLENAEREISCDTCSWHETLIGDTCACELKDVIRQLLEEANAD